MNVYIYILLGDDFRIDLIISPSLALLIVLNCIIIMWKFSYILNVIKTNKKRDDLNNLKKKK